MTAQEFHELDAAIKNALESAGIYLDVHAASGRVRLTGAVESIRVRDAALDIVSNVAGDADVVDEIEVQTSAPDSVFDDSSSAEGFEFVETPQYAEDQEGVEFDPDMMEDVGAGTSDVQEAIEEGEPYFPPTDPVVTPSDDDQELEFASGFQDTSMDELVDQPELDALETDPDAPASALIRDDESVRDDIIRELAEDAATTALDLTVEVNNGIAVITGSVTSIEDALAAEEVAGRVPGTREVREETTIQG